MIKHLILSNLVLVETSEIHFSPSFNVVTGETGAGKTAFIEAIGLALGDRADHSLIRKGCERAFIEIAFEIETLSRLKSTLEEAGLSIDPGEFLVIRREIAKEGKNRAFINCRTVPLPFLQQIGEELIDLVGHRTHHLLLHNDSQRNLIDLFGSLNHDLIAFQTAYAKEKELQKNLEELQQLSTRREKEEEIWRSQLEEIELVDLKKAEEDAVYERYRRLANTREISEKIEMMIKGLSEDPSAILQQLSRFGKACDSLRAYDSSFNEPASLIHDSQIALSEALRILQSYSQNIDDDPNAFQFLEKRLSDISGIKRKYGPTFEEVEAHRMNIKAKLSRFEHLSDEIQSAENALKHANSTTEQAAKHLTSKRKDNALHFQKRLTAQLQHLNMTGAELTIEILAQPRSQFGDDLVQFWLKANPGENPCLVKEHSSGGELSRLFFTVKTILAEKNNTPTLIFDEIDANVGGKTASIMGKTLQELGKCRQVICITHFPQVASKAETHFSVQKVEAEGRTKTEIRSLSKKEREQELLRMLGGKEAFVPK